jgi:tRNA G18 (ribose-2'-O)-methylase SpoU
MRHNNIWNKKIILSLIKDDLLSTRLVLGLEALGLDAGKYYLHLSETIFLIMGIEDEGLYKKYIEKSRTVMWIDVAKQPERLDKLVGKLYKMLERK